MKRDFSDDLGYVLSNVNRKAKYQFPLLVDKAFKDLPIAVLALSPKAMNILNRNKIFSMDELMNNLERVSHFRSCGIGTTKEIKNTFLQYWYDSLEEDEVPVFWEKFLRVNYNLD